jgi:hypothetical protein
VIAPQNNESAEGIQDVIVENNRFVRGPNTITDLRLAGRRITTRGNVFSAPNSFNIVTLSAGGPYFNLPSSWLGPYFTEVAPILPDLISPPPPPVLLP